MTTSPHSAPRRRLPGTARTSGISGSHGFTLIELLVAIAVMALMSFMAWQAVDGMSRTERITRERSDELLALQAGMGQWVADLDAMVEINELPSIDFDGRTLRLVRRDALESATESPGLQVVAWALQSGQWRRWQVGGLRHASALTMAWDAAARWGQRPTDEDAARQVAVAQASNWQVFYFRGDAWAHPLSAAGTSNSSASPATAGGGVRRWATPPDGVRVVLTLAPGQVLTGDLVRDWARPILGGGKS